MRSDHALFKRYPVDKHVLVAGETCPSPYHIYNGSLLFIGGTADGAAARRLLSNDRLTPLVDQNDRALAAVWLCDFTEANLGPHHELQISLFAAFAPTSPVRAHPFAIYRALTHDPATRMVCCGLWNSTARVVHYNTEHLHLNARLARSEMKRGTTRWQFQVTDDETSELVTAGDLALPARSMPATLWTMSRHIGVRGLMSSLRTPYVHVPVVNPRSRFADDNLVASTYTKNDHQVLRRFSAQDQLFLQHPQFTPLDFVPDFVLHSDGVRFVYLRPQPERPA